MVAAGVRDFLITILGSGLIAIFYFWSLRSPDRNAVTRAFNRSTTFWARTPLSVPSRAQLWIGTVVFTVIFLVALITFAVRLASGKLP